MENIYMTNNKTEERFLRKTIEEFDFKKFSRKEINELIDKMKAAMREANGVGLSANQIGVNLRMFIASVPDDKGGSKFYALFNPVIEKSFDEKITLEEGCLSVQQTFGEVSRPNRLILKAFDKNGRPVKIKAWGLLARVFQHELDHLNGFLFIDRAKNIRKIMDSGPEIKNINREP